MRMFRIIILRIIGSEKVRKKILSEFKTTFNNFFLSFLFCVFHNNINNLLEIPFVEQVQTNLKNR